MTEYRSNNNAGNIKIGSSCPVQLAHQKIYICKELSFYCAVLNGGYVMTREPEKNEVAPFSPDNKLGGETKYVSREKRRKKFI